MPEVLKIRFVGGPYHNELRKVKLSQGVAYLAPAEVEFGSQLPAIIQFYRLCHFRTEFGTIYSQYVDDSLNGVDGPHPSTFCEFMPACWPDGDQIWDKILSAVVSNPCQTSK